MNAVREPRSRRPGRAAGLLLVAIAAIALILGVITLVTGGSNASGGSAQNSAKPPPNTNTSPRPNPTTARPTTQPGTSTSQAPVTTTTTTNAPPVPDPRQVPIRVLNNGTVHGLAAQAAMDFRNDGWNVVEVGNYSQGIIPTSTAYYRPGTEEEAAAKALAAKFSMRADVRFPGIANSSPGVIVMITNDYGGK